MTPRERELLQGMGNCYEVCHADFQDTISMVGGARGLSPEEVRSILEELRRKYGETSEYQKLRSRLPKEFPI